MPPPAQPLRSLVDHMTSFMTITLSPALYKYSARQQLIKTVSRLEQYLQSHCLSYLYVSELTSDSNIHYHIMLSLKPMSYEDIFNVDIAEPHFIQEYKKYSKWFGFKKYDSKIHNHDNSFEYLTKDINRTHGLINLGSNKSKEQLPVWKYWARPSAVQIDVIKSGKVCKYFLDYEDVDIIDSPDKDEREYNLTNFQTK